MIGKGMAFHVSVFLARRSFLFVIPLGLGLSLTACRKAPSPVPSARAERRLPVEQDDPARQPHPAGVRPRVILIGLDGADWSILDRLAGSGRMPNLARIIREGRTARLKSFIPILSPVVWATIATGATPEVHGVLDFQEVDPDSGAAVPISGRSRRVPAVWNLASSRDLRVGVVGWWATHPAEEVKGFFVSDRASSILFEGSQDSMAYPPSLQEGVARIVNRENEIPDADLAAYLGMSAEEIATERRKGGGLQNPVFALARILGATRTVQRVSRELYDREAPDITAVYFEGTDAIGHVFAPHVPPRLDCVSEGDFRKYSGTVDAYYGMVDRLLGQWMRRAGEDGATLLLCSDHGFKWGEDRTCKRSSLDWGTAAFWHRLEGILAVWGTRVHASPARGEARVYDVAPTLCALLGLPVDPKMAGQALLSLFDGVSPPARQNVFENLSVHRLVTAPVSPAERDAFAQKLRALGYLSGSESKSLPLARDGPWPGRTEGAWNNLGLILREAERFSEAEHCFREALRLKSDYASPMFNLAVLERSRGRWDRAVEWLWRALEAGHAEPEQTILQWVASARSVNRRTVAVSLLEKGVRKYPQSEELAVALARLRFEGKDCEGAASALRVFAGAGHRDTLNLLGLSELCLGHREEARSHFERSLVIDPKQPPIREALRLMDGGG